MRNTTRKTWAGRVLAIAASVCMMCMMMVMPAVAEEVTDGLTATEDPRDSVMLISLGYEDDGGNFTDFKWGTCFLINDEYVLTNKHVVSMDPDEFNKFKADFGVPNLAANDSHIKLYLYVNRDMRVNATMHDSVNSDDMDFAAIKLAEKIYDRKPISLGDSDQIQTRDTVYAMGYPSDSISNKEYNTKADVSTVDGTISKVTVTENVDIIEHTAPLNLGNSGGPLLDEHNNVVGINTFIAGKKNYSIQINAIKKGLDTFGIPYVANGSSGAPETDTGADTDTDAQAKEPEEPDNTAILAELQDAVAEAKAKASEDAQYTEDSMKALNDSIGTAEAVLKKGNDAEESEIVSATDNLNDAIAGLEVKSGPNMLLIGGIAAAVILVIIIIIVIALSSGKKKKAAMNKPAGPGGYPNGPAGSGMGQSRMQGTTPIQTPPPAPEGAGETTLLDAGAGETTLLGGGRAGAYLLRKKNGEKIMINQQNFKIGKERRRVNYCVSDNTTVSRLHCEIVRRGADYYVTDQGSANCTYVNGVQLSPNKETLLSDRSVLKLSDEEFEFHLS
ncbi:MAG: trypsin-like peptidase domain-containing protein [Lachnospiraceae bacterium]